MQLHSASYSLQPSVYQTFIHQFYPGLLNFSCAIMVTKTEAQEVEVDPPFVRFPPSLC